MITGIRAIPTGHDPALRADAASGMMSLACGASSSRATIQEVLHAARISIARELRQAAARLRDEPLNHVGIVFDGCPDGRPVVGRAGRRQPLDGVKVNRDTAAMKHLEHVAAAPPCRDRHRRVAVRSQSRVGVVVEQHTMFGSCC